MRRITSNLAVWMIVSGISSFILIYNLFGHTATVEIASGLFLGACTVLALSWAFGAIGAVINRAQEGGDILAIGICAAFSFMATRQVWVMNYREQGRPDWMLDHWTNPFLVYSIFWGLLIMILAPGTKAGEIPALNKVLLLVAVMIGTLTAGIAIGFRLAEGGVL